MVSLSVPQMILAVNVGSTSAKLALFASQGSEVSSMPIWQVDINEGTDETSVTVERKGARETSKCDEPLDTALKSVLQSTWEGTNPVLEGPDIAAVGHRVVHGGPKFDCAQVITDAVFKEIVDLCPLAPLHQPGSIKGIETTNDLFPHALPIAVFDTSYFHRLPAQAIIYPVPYEWYEKFGIRRYGFHGISHQYCAHAARQFLQNRDIRRVITCHLGGGASITLSRNEEAVTTTMGFTPLEGLMMATRSGSIDPGIVLHMLEEKHKTLEEISHDLNHNSGLLGLSGISSDIRQLLLLCEQGSDRARLAIDVYIQSIASHICAALSWLGGADAIVFSAGVGEHSAFVREAVARKLAFLGVSIEEQLNETCTVDADISSQGATIRSLS